MKIGIIGGGLFGRIIALHLQDQRHDVVIIDACKNNSGLSAAGCLMKPSWISKIPRRSEALEILNQLVGVNTVPFTVLNKHVVVDDCYALDKNALFKETLENIEWYNGEVEETSAGTVKLKGGKTLEFELLIECTGAWSKHSKPKWGIAYEGQGEVKPTIKPWRPFTQLVRFNLRPNVWWAGDGTALNEMTPEAKAGIDKRVTDFMAPNLPDRMIEGMRPYAIQKTSQPCSIFLEGKQKIVVTGGGKNGTIAAGWAALELADAIYNGGLN